MEEKLELLLVKKYPVIFKNYKGDMKKTCMAWGFECGDGWYNLINKACKDIQAICDKHNIVFTAEQVKQKFGGLRFYYSTDSKKKLLNKIESVIAKELFKQKKGMLFHKLIKYRQNIYTTPLERIRKIVNNAEAKAAITCEICGKPGKKQRGGYIETLCNECKKEK